MGVSLTSLFVCSSYCQIYRNDESRESYKQTCSTKDYVTKRFWPEVNMSVNYPLNHILENEDLDISDEILELCFS